MAYAAIGRKQRSGGLGCRGQIAAGVDPAQPGQQGGVLGCQSLAFHKGYLAGMHIAWHQVRAADKFAHTLKFHDKAQTHDQGRNAQQAACQP